MPGFRAAPLFVIFDGQSLNGHPFGLPDAFPYKVMAARGPYRETWVDGFPWATLDDLQAVRVSPYCNAGETTIYNMNGGTADVVAGTSGATIYSLMGGMADAARGAGTDAVVAFTIPPATGYTGPQNTARTDANTAINNDAAGKFDAVLDVVTIPQLTNPADTDYYFDGTHWTAAAHTLVAAALGPIIDGLTP